eukprot:5269576-Pleurochrysis_carterae.AAC.1
MRKASSKPRALLPAEPLPPPFRVTMSAKRLIAFEPGAGAASVRAILCSICVPTDLASTALRNSTAVGSSALNGARWRLAVPFPVSSQNVIMVPLETSPAKYERGSEGPDGAQTGYVERACVARWSWAFHAPSAPDRGHQDTASFLISEARTEQDMQIAQMNALGVLWGMVWARMAIGAVNS